MTRSVDIQTSRHCPFGKYLGHQIPAWFNHVFPENFRCRPPFGRIGPALSPRNPTMWRSFSSKLGGTMLCSHRWDQTHPKTTVAARKSNDHYRTCSCCDRIPLATLIPSQNENGKSISCTYQLIPLSLKPFWERISFKL